MARNGTSLEQEQEWMRQMRSYPAASPANPPGLERHYTPHQVAELWNLDESTVRRVFIDEPGVFKLARPYGRKRQHITLRIPESVVLRVHSRRSGC